MTDRDASVHCNDLLRCSGHDCDCDGVLADWVTIDHDRSGWQTVLDDVVARVLKGDGLETDATKCSRVARTGVACRIADRGEIVVAHDSEAAEDVAHNKRD